MNISITAKEDDLVQQTTLMFEALEKKLNEKENKLEDQVIEIKEEYKARILDKEMEMKSLRMEICELRKAEKQAIKEAGENLKEERKLLNFQLSAWNSGSKKALRNWTF